MGDAINTDLIKTLRLNNSWSQQHLASIAGISLRTLQRIEREGSASLESRKAIASAFDLTPKDLILEAATSPHHKTARYGYIGILIGSLCAYAAITQSLLQGYASSADAGICYGVVAALAGISCALIRKSNKPISSPMRNVSNRTR